MEKLVTIFISKDSPNYNEFMNGVKNGVIIAGYYEAGYSSDSCLPYDFIGVDCPCKADGFISFHEETNLSEDNKLEVVYGNFGVTVSYVDYFGA